MYCQFDINFTLFSDVCFRAQYVGAHFKIGGVTYTANIDMTGTTTANTLTNTVSIALHYTVDSA